jgi:osmotically inducible protein OsmC
MALSLFLGQEGMTADSIETECTVSLDPVGGGFDVTSSHLKTALKIPNADKEKVKKAVETAKTGCPISKLLKTDITLEYTLT